MKNYILLILMMLMSTIAWTSSQSFTNNGGDNLWNNPANWSLGYVPISADSIDIGSIHDVIIPSGYNGNIKYLTCSSPNFIIETGASLNISSKYLNQSNCVLTNYGTLTIYSANNEGMLLYGSIINYGTINIDDATIGIQVKQSKLDNHGNIYITNNSDIAIFFGNIPIIGYPRKIINHADGLISITGAEDAGIWLNDTLFNDGTITINDVDRRFVNVPVAGIRFDAEAYLRNSGTIAIDDVEDYGMNIIGTKLENLASGEIYISNFSTYGIINNGINDNYGYIKISGTFSSEGGTGILLDNPIANKDGGTIEIDGNFNMLYGIDCNLGSLNNEVGAQVIIRETDGDGLRVDGGNLDNDGTITISNITDLLSYGLYCSTNCWNDGSIYIDNAKGIRADAYSFENHGEIIMTNLPSTGIFSLRKFNNYSDGTISLSGKPNETIIFGIVHVDDGLFGEGFFNEGSISIQNTAIGLEHRDGTMENSGSIEISTTDFGYVQNFFYDPISFTNSGSIEISDITTLGYAFGVEGGGFNEYTFINTSTGTVNIHDVDFGINAKCGMKNEGLITLNNLTEYGIWLNGVGVNADFLNDTGAELKITNAAKGIYFDGTLLGEVNDLAFTNNGMLTITGVSGELLDADDTNEIMENNGVFYGDGELDCSYLIMDSFIGVGDSIGLLKVSSFNDLNPTYQLDLTGDGSSTANNNNDKIVFYDAVNIGGDLEINSFPGFQAAIGEAFTLFQSQVSISGTFSTISYPPLPANMEWGIDYQSNKIVVSIIADMKDWLGAVNANWKNPANWEGGVLPEVDDEVLIRSGMPHNPIIGGTENLAIGTSPPMATLMCKSITVEDGANLMLQSDVNVRNQGMINIEGTLRMKNTSDGALTNSNGGQIMVSSTGQLVIKP